MLLPWLTLIPFIGGFLCWQTGHFGAKAPRWIALITMGLTLALSLQLWLQGGYSLTQSAGTPQWQSEFDMPWIPRFGISIHPAIDGLSLLMVVLTGLLSVLAVLCSWGETEKYQSFFHLNLMWVLGGVIGVFLTIDMLLFFFFWGMMLVPMYFLTALWGYKVSDGKTRITAATKFFIYTQTSGPVMLIVILVLVFVHYNMTGVWTFNREELLNMPTSNGVEYPLMLGFFIAFAARMPAVPLHGWLPDAHSQVPTAGSVDLVGISLKTVAYGLLHFSLPLFPDASAELAPVIAWLDIIGIFYGARMAFAQTDIKRLTAYTSVSHMGFVLIAIYTGSQLTYQGTIIQMVVHGLSAAGPFILCGQSYERIHTRDMRMTGGLQGEMKWLPALPPFFAVVMLGMPGTGNLVGGFMTLFGSLQVVPVIAVISTFGLVFASVYSLATLHHVYSGKAKSQTASQELPGISLRKLFMILLLVVPLVLLGFYLQPILDIPRSAIGNIQQWPANSATTAGPQIAMAITPQNLTALLPSLIVGLTVAVVMLPITQRRNYLLNTTFSVIGLDAALASLWFVGQAGAMDVTPLMYVDGFVMLYIGLVLLASLATCILVYPWPEGYNDNEDEFYLLVSVVALGGILLANANRLVSLFFGIGLISSPLFGLVGYVFRQKRSLEVSIKYTILPAAASSFLLFGMALVYVQPGDLSFVVLGRNLGDSMLNEPLLLAGFGLVIAGLGFKLSLVPFRLWTPDAYQGTPTSASTFLATASKIAISGVVMRLFLYAPVGDSEAIRVVLAVIAFASIIFGNLMVLGQTNIKRLLGYSSISHLGYLLATLIVPQTGEVSMEAVGAYLASYLFSSLGAFGVVSLMSGPYRGPDAGSLFSYRGLFWHRLILVVVMAVMMLSLAGIPMTLGFIGEFYVLVVGVQAHLWRLVGAVAVDSTVDLYYYLRVAASLYLHVPGQPGCDAPLSRQYSAGGIVVLISALLVLVLGVWPQPLISIVRLAMPLM